VTGSGRHSACSRDEIRRTGTLRSGPTLRDLISELTGGDKRHPHSLAVSPFLSRNVKGEESLVAEAYWIILCQMRNADDSPQRLTARRSTMHMIKTGLPLVLPP